MKTPTLLFALLLLSVSLTMQGVPMPQDIPLQKPKLLRDRENQERAIRMGREPFKTHVIDDTQLKIDDTNAEERIALVSAADKYVPGVTWHSESVISGDFTCRGRKEQAILGITAKEIVVVVFINGLQNKPEIVRDKVHTPADAELTIEGLDYDPREQVGVELEGFLRSKECKGLNIADNHVDSFHLYWNHKDSKFNWWSR
jgi:hypothetical protein